MDPCAGCSHSPTPPLDEAMEVTGCLVLELYASSDQPDADFIVKLSDVLPLDEPERADDVNPNLVTVTKGWLKASHRRKDDAGSKAPPPVPHARQPRGAGAGQRYRGPSCYGFIGDRTGASCSRSCAAAGTAQSSPRAVDHRSA
jgi:hypothetical protein